MPQYDYTKLPSKSSIRLLTDLHVDETATWSIPWRGREHPILKLVCSLKTVDLRNKPQYDCLSYTWGNPERVFSNKDQYAASTEWYAQKMPIVIDGAVLWIGQNLSNFLHHAAQHLKDDRHGIFKKTTGVEYSGCLWIDAMCINQQDDEEKGRQVSIMDQIYSNASVVLAWLGESDETTRRALEHLFELVRLNESAIEQASKTNLIHGDLTSIGFRDSRPGNELYAFFKRAYFRRAWILQEAVLAKRLVMSCGTVMVPLGYVLRAASTLYRTGWWAELAGDAKSRYENGVGTAVAAVLGSIYENKGYHPPWQVEPGYEPDYKRPCDPIYVLTEVSGVRRSLGNTLDLSQTPSLSFQGPPGERPTYKDLLTRYRILESGDPRDKIFAFLGLRPAGPIPQALQPIYTGESTTRATYIAATEYLIQTSANLDVLSHRENRESERSRQDTKLPSWVPDFETNWYFSIGDSANTTPESKPWSAAGDRTCKADVSFLSQGRLAVHGHRVDVILSAANAEYGAETLDQTAQLLIDVSLLRTDKPPPVRTVRPMNSGSSFSAAAETGLERAFQDGLSIHHTSRKLRHRRTNEEDAVQDDTWPQSGSDPLDAATRQTRWEMLWKTLLADTTAEGQHPIPSNYGEAFAYSLQKILSTLSAASWREVLMGNRQPEPQPEQESPSSKLRRVLQAVELLEAIEKQDRNALQMTREERESRARVPAAVISSLREHNDLEGVEALPQPPMIQQFWMRETQLQRGRHLFVTKDHGYLGYGPASLRPRDEVWLLAGAKVPFVLRRRNHGGYELIGYVLTCWES